MKENNDENNSQNESQKNENVEVKKMEREKLKLAVIGDHYTGKTSFINRICKDEFKDNVESTISTQIYYYNDYKNKEENENNNYIFELIDIGGQDYSIVINKIIVKNVVGIIFCCSSDQPKSLDNIEKWNEVCVDTLEKMEKVPKFIIINKFDEHKDFKKQKQNIENVKEKIKAKAYYYVSAKENEIKKEESEDKIKIDDLFDILLENLKKVSYTKEFFNENDLDLGLGLKRSDSDFSKASSQQPKNDKKDKSNCC